MIEKLIKLTQRPFVRHVAVVASGTAVAQVITMAFAPIITRLYGPEVYGVQGVFMSLVGVMSTFSALSYPAAIVIPKSDNDAIGLARLSIYIGLIASLGTSILLIIFDRRILAVLNAESISGFVYLVPVALLASVFSSVMSQWLMRKKCFTLASKLSVLLSFITNITKTGIGYLFPSAMALIVINILNALLGASLMLAGWKKSTVTQDATQIKHINGQDSVWTLAKKHYDFALFRTPQNFINAFSQSLPMMLLATYFGAASAGFYSISLAVLGMPAGLIGTSVMQVFYPKVNEAFHEGRDARVLIVNATIGMAIAGVLPFAIVMFAGPDLFAYVFGENWRTAGVYSQVLSPWLFFQYINKPAVSAIPALNLQGGLLMYELISTSTKLLGLYMGYTLFHSDVIGIALFSAFGVAAYLWLILWVVRHSNKNRDVMLIGEVD